VTLVTTSNMPEAKRAARAQRPRLHPLLLLAMSRGIQHWTGYTLADLRAQAAGMTPEQVEGLLLERQREFLGEGAAC
jgi:hypothetical protein